MKLRFRNIVLLTIALSTLLPPALAWAARATDTGDISALAEASAAPRKRPARSPTSVETNSIQRLGKGLAKALVSPVFRARIAEGLSKSPYIEQRIPLKRLLASDAEVRKELLQESAPDLSWEELAALLPELELYFPFANHREVWAGEAEIQVAVPAGISGSYRIYSTDGSARSVRDPNPPSVPTLLLAPSEIDYDDKDSALAGGLRTGAYLRQRAVDLGLLQELSSEVKSALPLGQVTAESSSGLDTSRHTYLTYFSIPNDHDPWPSGSMEIEVFGSVDGVHSGCQRFTDIEEGVAYYLPAPGAPGSRKIAHAVPTGSNTVDVKVYEDDDTGCSVRSGDDYLGVANLQIIHFDDLYSTSNGEATVRVGTQNTTCGDSSCGGDESTSNCCTDCGACPACGNGLCSGGETCGSCPNDCGTCPSPPVCGNFVCESGETCETSGGPGECQEDCSCCEGWQPICFAAGTPVTLADGSTKPIEQVTVGDLVLAYEEHSGKVIPARVSNTFVHTDVHETLLAINSHLLATAGHPFYVKGRSEPVRAEDLRVGDALLVLDGAPGRSGPGLRTVEVEALERRPAASTVYNIEVAGPHNYFAGGVLVHNKTGTAGCEPSDGGPLF